MSRAARARRGGWLSASASSIYCGDASHLASDSGRTAMGADLSRRSLLASLAVATGATIIGGRRLDAVPPPKETGLSSEGLLAGHPGFQPRTAMSLPHPELP